MTAAELWKLPDTWQWVELSQISDVVSKGTTPTTVGYSFTKTGVPFLRAEDISEGAINPLSVAFHIDLNTHNTALARSQLRPGDLLITIAGTLGRVGYVPGNAPSLNCNQAVAFVRLKPQLVDVKFAYFACQCNNLINSLVDVRKVATIGNLNLQQIQGFKIPLPPLPEQKRIASILAKADRLRRLHRYALELSSTYLQTVFLEMFGDPVTNPKGWKVEHLEERITFITSGSRGWAKYYSEKGTIFLRIQNIGINQLLLDDLTYVQVPDKVEGQRTQVQSGDLLLSITADLGRTAVIPEQFPEAYINQHLALLRLRDLNPVFVAGFISTPGGKAQITQLDRAGVKSGLNFDDIRGYQIFVPPRSLQDKFGQIVQKFERLRFQQCEALWQANHLFQTLLQQAFEGKLEPKPASLPSTTELENADDTQNLPGIPDTIEGKIYQLSFPVE